MSRKHALITMIFCENVFKAYPAGISKSSNIRALDGLSFSVSAGEAYGIVGPNGAGKSTILKILLGFVRQESGTVMLDGQESSNVASRQQVGFLPENPSLYQHLSINDHLLFCTRTAGFTTGQAKKKITEVLQTVQLIDSAHLPVKQFSKGMKQRASLAYALILQPKILILDEPMSGLDPLGRELLVDIVRNYHAQGNTILFCSHILTDVERICNRIGIMHKGQMVTETNPEELVCQADSSKGQDGKSPLEIFFVNTIHSVSMR